MHDHDTSNRLQWHEVPPGIRAEVENRLGAPVVSAVNQPGGFSHGVAARLELANRTTAFAKAIDTADGDLARMYRTEVRTAALLPPNTPTPPLRFAIDRDGWLVAVFEFIEGRHPQLGDAAELSEVLTVITQLAQVLTPGPPETPTIAESYGPVLNCWQKFADHGPPSDLDDWSLRHLDRLAALESTWLTHAAGETLLHTDLRADNMLYSNGKVRVVDWAWPCRGAAWIDLIALAPYIAAAGTDPDPILSTHPVTQNTDPTAINAFLCALVGSWTTNARRPPPPRSPRLRPQQARSAEISREWLRRRLGW